MFSSSVNYSQNIVRYNIFNYPDPLINCRKYKEKFYMIVITV